jgi:hypothetical protein
MKGYEDRGQPQTSAASGVRRGCPKGGVGGGMCRTGNVRYGFNRRTTNVCWLPAVVDVVSMLPFWEPPPHAAMRMAKVAEPIPNAACFRTPHCLASAECAQRVEADRERTYALLVRAGATACQRTSVTGSS